MTAMIHAASSVPSSVPQFHSPRQSTIAIRDERFADVADRERLLDSAFGAARFRKTCERLREGRVAADGLSLVAHDGGTLVGTVRLWHVDAGAIAALMLGPLAVAQSHRTLGIGGRLMREALARAKARGHAAVLLVGDAPYYARFGFTRANAATLALPGPVDESRFLGLELEAGALAQARGLVSATGRMLDAPAWRAAA